MFRIEMLPAGRGDALWIEYGDPAAPNAILVDAGTSPTYEVVKQRILGHAATSGTFELFIVTHIDTDHVGGALPLVADDTPALEPGEIWVNVWRHLQADTGGDRLGAVDGEILSALLDRAGWRWNETFGGGAALAPDKGPLPAWRLPGGMTLTLLSPGPAQLRNLSRNWRRVVQDAGLDPAQPRQSEQALKALAARRGIRPERLGHRLDVRNLSESSCVPDRSPAERQHDRRAGRIRRPERAPGGRRVRRRHRRERAPPGRGARPQEARRRRVQAAAPREPGQPEQ